MSFYYDYNYNKKKTKPSNPDGYFTDTSMKVNTTKTFDIEAVIDPKTQKEVSAEEAVQRGIIDEATGNSKYLCGECVLLKDNTTW